MSLTKIAPALLAAQKEMGNAAKDAKNPFFKSSYSTLNSVREAVTPALHKHGIVLLQSHGITLGTGQPYVETMLLHESGEFITSQTAIVCKEANNPQALGSAISYARRYGLASMLSIGAEDDDGNFATFTKPVSNGTGKAATATTATTATAPFGSFRK